MYLTCNGYNETVCSYCYTGARNCSLYDCFTPGICLGGAVLNVSNTIDENECLDRCERTQDCQWFNYEPVQNNICVLTDECLAIDESCGTENCIHGQVECSRNNSNLNIFVAIGYSYSIGSTDHVEVINTQSIESCPTQPTLYPHEAELAMAMKYQNKVVICGGRAGSTLYSDCNSYDYVNDKWDLEPFRLEPARMAAISVEIRPDEWLILGGADDYYGCLTAASRSDSLIFKDGQFFPGPDAPEPICFGAAVMLDAERLFISDDVNTKRNFILDVNTFEWTEVAGRIYAVYEGANIGTFYNSSVDEIQVARISKQGIEIYSPRDDTWHANLHFPPEIDYLYSSVAIQQGQNSFVLIGGNDSGSYSNRIYHFDENGLKIFKENVLDLERDWHIAIPIPEKQFGC